MNNVIYATRYARGVNHVTSGIDRDPGKIPVPVKISLFAGIPVPVKIVKFTGIPTGILISNFWKIQLIFWNFLIIFLRFLFL